MSVATYIDADGTHAGTVQLPDEIFAVEPNVPVMHAVVKAHLAAVRVGTHSTKTRAEVRGGGRKPWRDPNEHMDTWKSFRNLPYVLMTQMATTYRVLAADVVVLTKEALREITGADAEIGAPAATEDAPAVTEDAPAVTEDAPTETASATAETETDTASADTEPEPPAAQAGQEARGEPGGEAGGEAGGVATDEGDAE